ncbi:hypothetical protein IG631_15459 [Alternaria alternata]|nr:hypothetical protein IG631_15459 [Alternaria alternata]
MASVSRAPVPCVTRPKRIRLVKCHCFDKVKDCSSTFTLRFDVKVEIQDALLLVGPVLIIAHPRASEEQAIYGYRVEMRWGSKVIIYLGPWCKHRKPGLLNITCALSLPSQRHLQPSSRPVAVV